MTVPLSPLTRGRLDELLAAMRQVTVVVVGDAMLDRYLEGDVERISPEAPVPVVTVEEERSVPGGAANVAANVAALGAEVALVGVCGDDPAGEALIESLGALGIGADGLTVVPGRPTTTKTRIVARGQQVARIDREVVTPLPDRYREALDAAAAMRIADADVLLVEDYDKGAIDAAMAGRLMQLAAEQGVPTVIDPKTRHFFDFPGATVFKPNRRELEQAFGTHFAGDDADLVAARARLGASHLLLTLGAEGMVLVSDDGILRRAPSDARQVFDVSGAGDTVTAWVGTAIAAGAAVHEAAWLANLAAGVKVTKSGTATVAPDEVVEAWMRVAGS